jgi:hypothetical protein
MLHKTKTFQVFLVNILSIIIYGCSSVPSDAISTPLPEQMDTSPFTGIPCAAPCWYGLEVGRSSENEVFAILPTITFIDQKSIQIHQRPSVPDYYIELYGPGVEIIGNCINFDKECIVITIANDVLQEIVVNLNYEIKPDEAISYLGNPDHVGYANLGTERIMCEVYLIWSSKRLVLASRFEDVHGSERYCNVVRDEGKIPLSLVILEARYLPHKKIDMLLSPESGKVFEFTGIIPDE